jgi:glycosyltransferase involved in cell wall biosynthesis
MNVIGLYDGFGPSYHRIYTPLKNIFGVENILITNRLTDERLEKSKCDVLFFNRIPPGNTIEEVIEGREKYGYKIVVDMDDHFQLDAGHIMHDYYQQHNISNMILQALTIADAVTVTHEKLGEALTAYNSNIWVLPNAICNSFEQFSIDRQPSDKVRLFWQGSITHEKDINILKYPLCRISNDSLRDKIMMVMAGYHEGEATWQRMAHDYTAGLNIPGSILPGGKVEDYYQNYKFADVALVPLVQSRFNSYKSNLKVLEAANMGIPVVVSNVEPYADVFPPEFVNYVRSQKDWYANIKKLVTNERFRYEQGQALRTWCNLYYNFDHINSSRFDLFKSLCSQ